MSHYILWNQQLFLFSINILVVLSLILHQLSVQIFEGKIYCVLSEIVKTFIFTNFNFIIPKFISVVFTFCVCFRTNWTWKHLWILFLKTNCYLEIFLFLFYKCFRDRTYLIFSEPYFCYSLYKFEVHKIYLL